MDQAARGASALKEGRYAEAVMQYSAAISHSPGAVDYYIKRSTAYQRSSPPDYTAALQDAEIAVNLATQRGKRELIAQAQLRRGIALFGLERYADAGHCFGIVRQLNEKESSLLIWEKKVEGKLKGLEGGTKGKDITVKDVPDVELPSQGVKVREKKDLKMEENIKKTVNESKVDVKAEVVQTPANKIRHEWYQTADHAIIELFAKGVPRNGDKHIVDIENQSVSISFPLVAGSDYNLTFYPLYAPIDVVLSTYDIKSTKIEIKLKKKTPGQKWPSLEGDLPVEEEKDPMKPSAELSETPLRRDPTGLVAHTHEHTPSYPTSSKAGPKNWDKLADDLTKKHKKKAKKEGEGGGVTEDDVEDFDYDDEGDPVNGFFKKLYKDADPDTRRAMMKSYQESNGTALSTNWAEVGKGKVETSPPEGMEAKKWGD
ncbi:MAG: hypothetical protein M1830_010162 [Pleopsidium flavum]|nr:MAG: hypothetical protein M1830_010162 [Pleopsidium flavum]